MKKQPREYLQEIVDASKYYSVPIQRLRRDDFLASPCKRLLTNRQIIRRGGWCNLRAQAAASDEPRKSNASTYVVTYAQDGTPIYRPFFEALQAYCKERSARLIVIPGRYRNATSGYGYDKSGWYAPELRPHLCFERVAIHPHLTVYPINITPTAVNPLSGLEGLPTHSAIVGHTKQTLEAKVSLEDYARLFSSTGSVTSANFSDTKAGAKAETHHSLGACVIELSDGLFYARHVTAASDGSFTDLGHTYSRDGKRVARPAHLIVGDSHFEKGDQNAMRATIEQARFLKCETITLHDVLDFTSENHHSRRDPFFRMRATSTVKGDLDTACDAINLVQKSTEAQVYIVRSNHDEALERWLKETSPWDHPKNSATWLECAAACVRQVGRGEPVNALSAAFSARHKNKRVRFLRRCESHLVNGYECGEHGDKGINGSRGSKNQFSRIGKKMVLGHSHSPWRKGAALGVGVTGQLDQGYNHPRLSSWMQSNVAVYADGSATHLHIIDGKWRA